MKINGYEIIENIDRFPFDKIEHGFISNGKRGKGLTYYYKPIVTLDTETSRLGNISFITDISITIENLATFYCHTIDEMFRFFERLQAQFSETDNKRVIIYVHNLSYDYAFLRNRLIDKYGYPINSLAVKTHKYVSMDFGFYEFRDSYILTQKNLEKLTEDEKVEVKKAVGFWDYNKLRSPRSFRTDKEKYYVNVDTISLCLALRSVMESRNVNTGNCPLTSTGFIRNEARKRSRVIRAGKKWRTKFKELALSFDDYQMLENVFHGGYTHANRYFINETLTMLKSFDFASSYPAVLLYEKFPMKPFERGTFTYKQILESCDKYAYFGIVCMTKVKFKDNEAMPPIAKAKCKTIINDLLDNGRVISADYLEVYFSDPDLDLFVKYYDFDIIKTEKVRRAEKGYLPDWFKEFVQELYYNKCTLKDVDPTNYAISKTYINAMYGMLAQKIMREILEENFQNCDWNKEFQTEDDFQKYYNNRNSFLPYQWAIWVTAYAQHNLFELGKCCENWVYSDTDSCKGFDWDLKAVQAYNDKVKQKAKEVGFGIVNFKNKEFVIGQAEDETDKHIITEFRTLGCKRYCYRQTDKKGKDRLHLTVAGVPKIAVAELENDIENFGKGFTFRGKIEGNEDYKGSNKLRPDYHINNDIQYINVLGTKTEVGSWINLEPVDYILDQTVEFDSDTGLPRCYDFDRMY